MYQTALIAATTLSRNAGPVCMTRLAMRPAKSFWKNVQLCRTTCQWFCQRIMLVKPGRDRLVGDEVLRQQRQRPHDQQHRRHAERAAARLRRQQRRRRRCAVTSVTTRPMKTGIIVSSSATSEAGDEQRDEEPSPGGR